MYLQQQDLTIKCYRIPKIIGNSLKCLSIYVTILGNNSKGSNSVLTLEVLFLIKYNFRLYFLEFHIMHPISNHFSNLPYSPFTTVTFLYNGKQKRNNKNEIKNKIKNIN